MKQPFNHLLADRTSEMCQCFNQDNPQFKRPPVSDLKATAQDVSATLCNQAALQAMTLNGT